MSPTPATRSATRTSGSWLALALTGTAIFVAGLGLGAVLVAWFGHVRTDEFSPDLFERRTVSYFELPLVHRQISPVSYLDTTSDLAAYLTTNNYVTRQTSAPRWDAVEVHRGAGKVTEGDAKILTTYFDRESFKEDGPLMTWTKDHPALAKVLWPAVATTVRDGHYVFLPDLLELGRAARDPKALALELKRALAEKYVVWGGVEEEREQVEAAAAAYQRALEFEPNHAAAKTAAARLKAAMTP